MGMFRNPWAIVLLILLVVLLFGAGKLPGLARNLGQSMRIFKSEVEEMRGDEKRGDDEDESDRPARSDRARDDREYDPRDREVREDRDRETVRAPREDDEPYRRD